MALCIVMLELQLLRSDHVPDLLFSEYRYFVYHVNIFVYYHRYRRKFSIFRPPDISREGLIQELFILLLPRCMECRRSLQMRILSVCPSVCLSVTRVHCDKTVERAVQIYIPYEKSYSLVF